MEKVYCVRDYKFFKKGTYYYSKIEKVWSSGTFVIMYKILDMNSEYVGDMGYLYDDIFELIKVRRKRLIRNLLNDKSKIV